MATVDATERRKWRKPALNGTVQQNVPQVQERDQESTAANEVILYACGKSMLIV